MATITLVNLFARARTIATQMGIDATESNLIDNLAGLRALLPSCINEIYRTKAKDQKFSRDITTRHTIAMTSNVGAVPSTILKEFLHQADFTDAGNSLVTYFNYAVDFNSSQTFGQLGYVYILGDNFQYRRPGGLPYTGDLYVTTPSTPAVSSTMTFPSEATIDDVVLLLARAIRGEHKFEVVDAV